MSSWCWLDSFHQALSRLRLNERPARVAVVGIGTEMGGDDAAGIILARDLAQISQGSEHLLVIDAGPAPENVTGLLRRFRPDLVLLVDAAQMDEAPGAVRWLDWRGSEGLSASTHTLPLHLVATYLVQELSCEVALIGIQPARNNWGRALSPQARQAVAEIVRTLSDALAPSEQSQPRSA